MLKLLKDIIRQGLKGKKVEAYVLDPSKVEEPRKTPLPYAYTKYWMEWCELPLPKYTKKIFTLTGEVTFQTEYPNEEAEATVEFETEEGYYISDLIDMAI